MGCRWGPRKQSFQSKPGGGVVGERPGRQPVYQSASSSAMEQCEGRRGGGIKRGLSARGWRDRGKERDCMEGEKGGMEAGRVEGFLRRRGEMRESKGPWEKGMVGGGGGRGRGRGGLREREGKRGEELRQFFKKANTAGLSLSPAPFDAYQVLQERRKQPSITGKT